MYLQTVLHYTIYNIPICTYIVYSYESKVCSKIEFLKCMYSIGGFLLSESYQLDTGNRTRHEF